MSNSNKLVSLTFLSLIVSSFGHLQNAPPTPSQPSCPPGGFHASTPGHTTHSVEPSIKNWCSSTDYPDLCIAAVAPFIFGKPDLFKVIDVAIKSSIENTNTAISAAKRIANSPQTSPGLASILKGSLDIFVDALDNFKKAQGALSLRDWGTVKITLNGAISNFGHCETQFTNKGVPMMMDFIHKLKMMTSNCLSLCAIFDSSHASTKSPTTGHASTPGPSTKSPTTGHTSTPGPSTKSPTTGHTSTPGPSTKSPTTGHPSTPGPSTKSPTTGHASTPGPSTKSPTTGHPSTPGPSTQSPTTGHPSTPGPSTKSPTTGHASTPGPSTKSPTTVHTSTPGPSTKSPTTGHTTHNVEPSIKKWCNSTDYPDLCIAAVAPFIFGKPDLFKVIDVAIKSSVENTNTAILVAKRIANSPLTPSGMSSILKGSLDIFAEALDNFKKAEDALSSHDWGTVKTMLSGAISNFMHCEIQFTNKGVPMMMDFIHKLKMMTSNCITLCALFDPSIASTPGPSIKSPTSGHATQNVEPSIKNWCNSTDYPDLCITAVAPLITGKPDLFKVIEVAIKFSVEYTNMAILAAKNIANSPLMPSGMASILKGSLDIFADALDNFKKAEDALSLHDWGTVKTMLSGAISNFVHCEIQFTNKGMPMMMDFIHKLKMMTSNCISLCALFNPHPGF